MDKKRPTYDLEAIQAALGSVSTPAMTTTAFRDAVALGYDRAAVVMTRGSIERRLFYRSKTTNADIVSGRTSTMFP
jgi:motility quorum-sensing regulator/GCU-specific mRNA interferase toxin